MHKKVKLFNLLFDASQCTLLNNESVQLPLHYKKKEGLASVNVKGDDIYLLLKSLNPKKTHIWDDMSIRIFNFAKTLS